MLNLAVAHCLWSVVVHSLQASEGELLNLDFDAFIATKSASQSQIEPDMAAPKRRRLDTIAINLWPKKMQTHIEKPKLVNDDRDTQSQTNLSQPYTQETSSNSSAPLSDRVHPVVEHTFRELFQLASSILQESQTAKQQLAAMHALHVLVFGYTPLRRFGPIASFDKIYVLARQALRVICSNTPTRFILQIRVRVAILALV